MTEKKYTETGILSHFNFWYNKRELRKKAWGFSRLKKHNVFEPYKLSFILFKTLNKHYLCRSIMNEDWEVFNSLYVSSS